MNADLNQSTAVVSVVVIEDDEGVRESLRILLDGTSGFLCAGTFADAETALARLARLQPQVVLMDINLPGMSGIKCAGAVKTCLPQVQIVMLTIHEDDDAIFDALAAGASGYLLKRSSPIEILEAISDVHSGGAPMSSTIARKVIRTFHQREPSDPHPLSPRESEILELLAKGFLYKEIADRLGLTFHTVHTHLAHIYQKLHVRSRTEAVAKYLGG